MVVWNWLWRRWYGRKSVANWIIIIHWIESFFFCWFCVGFGNYYWRCVWGSPGAPRCGRWWRHGRQAEPAAYGGRKEEGGSGEKIDAYNLSIGYRGLFSFLCLSFSLLPRFFFFFSVSYLQNVTNVNYKRGGGGGGRWGGAHKINKEKSKRRATSTEYLVVIISAPKFNYIFRWGRWRGGG